MLRVQLKKLIETIDSKNQFEDGIFEAKPVSDLVKSASRYIKAVNDLEIARHKCL